MSKKLRNKKSNSRKLNDLRVKIAFKDLVLLQTGTNANPVPYIFKKGKCYYFDPKAGLMPIGFLEVTRLEWRAYTFVAYENTSGLKVDLWEYDYSPCYRSHIEKDIGTLLHNHIGSVNRRIRINFGSILSLQNSEITKEQLMTLLNNTDGFWDTENKGMISTENEAEQDSINLMLSLDNLMAKESKL